MARGGGTQRVKLSRPRSVVPPGLDWPSPRLSFAEERWPVGADISTHSVGNECSLQRELGKPFLLPSEVTCDCQQPRGGLVQARASHVLLQYCRFPGSRVHEGWAQIFHINYCELMGTNTMASIQACQIQAIMTVPERLSFLCTVKLQS